jgi:hypothetical protein
LGNSRDKKSKQVKVFVSTNWEERNRNKQCQYVMRKYTRNALGTDNLREQVNFRVWITELHVEECVRVEQMTH